MIVWDVMQWKMARGVSAYSVMVPGRVVSVTLKSVESTATVRIIGVYAPCRGQREKKKRGQETQGTHEHREEDDTDMWDELEGDMEKGDDIIIVGDMNAETKETMVRSSREESRQDVRFQQMIERVELTHLSVGRATYRDKSEIDHVLTTASARKYLKEPEWRKGQTIGDHGAVWVKMTVAEAEDKAAHGEDRPRGVALKHMGAEECDEIRRRGEDPHPTGSGRRRRGGRGGSEDTAKTANTAGSGRRCSQTGGTSEGSEEGGGGRQRGRSPR